MFMDDRQKFVKIYLADLASPRDPQTKPMSLGSSFDAFVKNELARCLYGGRAVQMGEEFHLETLFKAQVPDEGFRDWAWENGGYLFLKYKDQGAFDDLLVDMEDHKETPQFEVNLMDNVVLPNGTKVPMRGFPDCYYRNSAGALVILDWKCNNYCGKRKMSPKKHYILERPTGRVHKNTVVVNKDGTTLDGVHCFSETDVKWATQMTIYNWMLGGKIGKPFIGQIEQLLCGPSENGGKPDCRSITYRGYISEKFQYELCDKIDYVWKVLTSGHIFDNLSREESDIKFKELERVAAWAHDNNPVLDIIRNAKTSGR
jgi:hypothetical protein